MAGISFSGVASGIQWGDLVDQLIAAESARSLTPLTQRLTLLDRQRTAWNDLKGLLDKLEAAARELRTGETFGQYAASGGTSATSGQALVTATAGTGAAPGTYTVEVRSLARAQKLSGAVVADATAALGISGSFTIAGQTVTVQATDSLAAIRDRINALNAGATPTRVSASIVSGATGGARLVLTAETPGAEGIALEDGEEGVLRQLGVLDSQTRLVSSADLPLADALGSLSSGSTTLNVNGRIVAVDTASDSLADIAARLRAAGVSAAVVSVPFGSDTMYRLQIGGHVTATPDAGSAELLAALGIGVGGTGTDRQIVASGVLGAAGGGVATGATSLVGLTVDGSDHGIAVGDAIQLTGTRGDGSTFTIGLTVQVGDTIDTLLARLNDPATGVAAGSRPAEAVLGADGRLRLVDSLGGDSQLAFSLSVMDPDGTTTTLGTSVVEVTGRAREVTAGSSAQVAVDGVLYTASGSELTGAIPGVTLKLERAEPGTVTEITVSRDDAKTVEQMKEFVDAYNAIVDFVEGQRAEGQPLSANSTLRGALAAITNALRTEVTAAGEFTRGAVVGLSLDRYGKLQLDESKLRDALVHSVSDVRTLFGGDGVGGALENVVKGLTRSGDGTIATMTSSIETQKNAIERRKSDVERRLEMRREYLEAQFIAMESLVAQLQSQGNWLASQIGAFYAQRR